MESLNVKKFLASTMLVASLAVLAIGSANAVVIAPVATTSISFATPTGDLGDWYVYGPITAYGFTGNGRADRHVLTATHLYGKSNPRDPGESGLGLMGNDHHEINAPAGTQAIILDISRLMGEKLKIGFGSVQEGEYKHEQESWRVGFSNSAMLPSNESAFSGFITGTTDYPDLYNLGVRNSRYLIVEAASGDVLLRSLSYTHVPEPASMALLGAGLVGMGYARRRASRA